MSFHSHGCGDRWMLWKSKIWCPSLPNNLSKMVNWATSGHYINCIWMSTLNFFVLSVNFFVQQGIYSENAMFFLFLVWTFLLQWGGWWVVELWKTVRKRHGLHQKWLMFCIMQWYYCLFVCERSEYRRGFNSPQAKIFKIRHRGKISRKLEGSWSKHLLLANTQKKIVYTTVCTEEKCH